MLKAILSIMILSISVATHAGDKVGNGGGIWACSSSFGGLRTGLLVDLYEAEEEFGLTVLSTSETDPMKIVQERSDYVRSTLPELSIPWNRTLTSSLDKIRFVNSELVVVDDALFRMKPPRSSCQQAWTYTQFANFTNQDQILIRQDLWLSSQIKATHKAALVWHEVIYKWLRDDRGDRDSVRARQIVGILFSTLSPSEMRHQLQKVLANNPNQPPPPPPAPKPEWICMVSNRHASMFFADYGRTELEAKTKTLQKCQKSDDGFFCESTAKCEEIKSSQETISCENKNNHIDQTYLGIGRSLLEAEYRARDACQQTEQRFFCESRVTCQ